MTRAVRRNTEVLRDYLEIKEQSFLDVGCGKGALVGWLRKQGAFAIGLDPQSALLTPPAIAALGHALPLASKSFDNVIFFNSLHHIPKEHMDAALNEAARVAREHVVIVEPIAEGSYFQTMQPVDDETDVRAWAYQALKSSACLEQSAETEWQLDYVERDLNEVISGMIRVDPKRASRIEEVRNELARRFESLGRKVDDGYAFDQPMRLNLMRALI